MEGLDHVSKDVDIYHIPFPAQIDNQKAKVVVTVNDLVHRLFPETQTEQAAELSEMYFQDIAAKADKIICISDSTREDLHQFYNIDRDRTCVVHLGVNHASFYRMGEEDKEKAKEHIAGLGVKDPFLFFVGTLEPRKNLKNIMAAFAKLREARGFKGKLVIAGMKGWMSDDLEEHMIRLNIQEQVVFLGYLTDDGLRYLYNLCEVFVFPTFYEGFGYPLIEAMACGSPVVTSNTSSLKEISEGFAEMVTPSSIFEISEAIDRILKDENRRADLRAKGLVRAREFTHEKMARETLDVYREVL